MTDYFYGFYTWKGCFPESETNITKEILKIFFFNPDSFFSTLILAKIIRLLGTGIRFKSIKISKIFYNFGYDKTLRGELKQNKELPHTDLSRPHQVQLVYVHEPPNPP
ncbi:hypothetical protein BpHYR1_030859 [Brachionus plicatilis]|uniref:Uncharacterized protein n=1 Tax=Brachionus plicatilis TaxID=10195 RepID=A0A3M7Q3H7_BRAPC|nr:hypothetical protein BpHYR1_030859 [Brachionus plicatilis]